jgi:hypothetical protein
VMKLYVNDEITRFDGIMHTSNLSVITLGLVFRIGLEINIYVINKECD